MGDTEELVVGQKGCDAFQYSELMVHRGEDGECNMTNGSTLSYCSGCMGEGS